MCSDLFAAQRDLQTVGVHRILTSGGEQTSTMGAQTLKRLVLAAGSISIMARRN
jgi:copper homeostasis protein CutC